jgi:hypothetical protein
MTSKHNNKISRDVRFWDCVNKKADDECWEWTAGLSKTGYGLIHYKNVEGKFSGGDKAHRFSFELHNERAIETGKHILHSCDNRKCVNPHHLREGTNAENMKDMVDRKRSPNNLGFKNPNVSLTDEQVLEIRERWGAGGITQQKLADEYKVNQTQISKIVLRQQRTNI